MISFLVSAICLGMTFLYGSTGETITQKAGHLNLGIPGVMCVGASFGCTAASWYYTATHGNMNAFFGIVIPIVVTVIGGALMGLLYSFLTVSLRANQNVTGLVLTTFGVGLSDFMISKLDGQTFAAVSPFFTAKLPFASDLGWFGQLFLAHGILVYLGIAIALIASFVLKKTRIGLHLRAVGENPATADAAGINVTAYRYGATCIGCGIAGLGGFTYIMDYLGGNWEYDIEAMGWLAIALVIFTVWKPNLGVLGSFLFGALYILYSRIPGLDIAAQEIFKMLPYVVTILVLIITSARKKRETQPPASLGVNYFREER